MAVDSSVLSSAIVNPDIRLQQVRLARYMASSNGICNYHQRILLPGTSMQLIFTWYCGPRIDFSMLVGGTFAGNFDGDPACFQCGNIAVGPGVLGI
jgi:hypothetical protein